MYVNKRFGACAGGWAAAVVCAGLCLLIGLTPAVAGEEKPDFPEFAEVTKDMKVKEGFFTLYHDKKKDKLLARVPADQLNKNFLIALSIARGPFFAGWQIGEVPVYWDRMGKKLVLMAVDTGHVKTEGTAVEDVIRRTYTDTILKAVPIETEVGGDPVIDLGKLLKSDTMGLAGMFGGSMNAGLSRYGSFKSFESNTEVSVDAAIMSGRGGQIYRIHYSMSALPEGNGYTPRAADDRVGYFMVAQKDWATGHDADTIFKRYVNRWQLRKAEPDQAVSDVRPEDQIVFYIEKTVPVQYRRYVREGILEWNHAFEAAGLRNAVVVHQQTETMHADKDPEDVKYNFFRWIVSGSPFAMGPSRVNPFTGQILDADIIFDDSMLRYVIDEYDVYGPKSDDAYTDAPVDEFLAHHPEWDHSPEWLFPSETSNAPKTLRIPEVLSAHGRHRAGADCELGAGMVRALGMASLVATQNGKRDLPEEFIGQAIKETVMHEVGHTLGLRHNFKASSWLKLAAIKNQTAETNRPTTASVMDYNAYNYAEAAIEQSHFVTPTLGPYDHWAIEYGYRPFMADKDEDAPKDEADMLKAIASRCAEDGLDYATDEDTSLFYPDPTVNRWDMGKDPIDFARDYMTRAKRLWVDGLDWAIKDGESRHRARRVFGMLLGHYSRGAQMVGRVVGGQYIHRDHKGDPNERPATEVVSVGEQREALAFLSEHVLSDAAFTFSPELLTSLAAGRWGHWDSDAYDSDLSYDIHDRVLSIQSRALFQLMNPFTVNRVYDAELKVAASEEALTVVELFTSVSEAVWTELDDAGTGKKYTNRKPMVSSFRRSLQRAHLRRLIDIVLAAPGRGMTADAHAIARRTLAKVGDRVTRAIARADGKLDDYTAAHLMTARTRIEKALDAEFAVRAPRQRARATARFHQED